jgi:hypothetical protein
VAKRRTNSYEKRLDARGRELWYRLDREGKSRRVSRPRSLRKGDVVLDLTADGPTRLRHAGGRKGLKKTPISEKTQNDWIRKRAAGEKNRGPVARAVELRNKLVRGRRKVNPDRVRVFYEGNDGRMRRFTVSSFERFMKADKYREARDRLEADGRFLVGLMNLRTGDLQEEIEELGGGLEDFGIIDD